MPTASVISMTALSALVTSVLEQPLPPQFGTVAPAARAADPRYYTQRGMERFKRKQVQESIEDFDKVIELSPAKKPYMWYRAHLTAIRQSPFAPFHALLEINAGSTSHDRTV